MNKDTKKDTIITNKQGYINYMYNLFKSSNKLSDNDLQELKNTMNKLNEGIYEIE